MSTTVHGCLMAVHLKDCGKLVQLTWKLIGGLFELCIGIDICFLLHLCLTTNAGLSLQTQLLTALFLCVRLFCR